MMLLKRKFVISLLIFGLVSLVVVVLSTFLGVPLINVHRAFLDTHSVEADLLFRARLPRILLAFVVGGSLSVSGLSFQCLLRNPLADPYVLGVSGGAALGSVVGLVLGVPYVGLVLLSFASGLISLVLIYLMAQRAGVLVVHNLLLSGVIFNAFSFALILLINALSTSGEIQQIFYVLVGSVEAVNWEQFTLLSLFVLIGFVLILSVSKSMNALLLGEEAAHHLGVSVDTVKRCVFMGASLMVGASVSIAGLVGFVGLFVPHMMRLLWGNDLRLQLPLTFLGGGIFLVSCDYLVRLLFGLGFVSSQLPVGVVTALIGGPFFFYLLKRR